MKRRAFIKLSAASTAAVAVAGYSNTYFASEKKYPIIQLNSHPRVLSTWNHGLAANEAAWKIMERNGTALDAVEKGVRVTESDPNNRSVGLGGLPDANGLVTLDACIMDQSFNCGSVSFLQNIENPISVARKIMEDTPHVMLSGKGAYDFAIQKGFKHKNLLTQEAKLAWEKWIKDAKKQKPIINNENHDTIGMLAIDKKGNLSGACTTSGWAYKLHGRVGDSPLIGAGLYVDNEVGAACATGLGEAVIRICGSHTVVELMRQGISPQNACKQAVERIIKAHNNLDGLQVGFIALNKQGEFGAYSVYSGFNFALKDSKTNSLINSKYEMDW